jgi:flavin-dependent dehydrogenase
VARLARWGLLDRVVASNCPPVRQLRFDVGPFALAGTPPPAVWYGPGEDEREGRPVEGDAGSHDTEHVAAEAYVPRRIVLDQILVEAAVAAGAELRTHFAVEDLVWNGDRVTGIQGRTRGNAGAPIVERARIVIGADGVHSMVARHVDAPIYDVRPNTTCAYYSYWSDVPVSGAELYPRPDRMVIAGPTNDGLTTVISYWPVADFHAVRADVEGHLDAALDLAPGLAERVRAGRRVERFRGTADLPNFFRRPYGPGWALVGDAGYHKNPITAQGITDAFRDAELLAAALDDGFSDRRSLEDALAGYERRRNTAARPLYELTGQLSALQPPSAEMQQLLGALRHDQGQTNRFFGVIAGTVPGAEFYAPENLGRLMATAGALSR